MITVVELASAADSVAGAALLQAVWQDPIPPVAANLLRAVQHSGGYVFGARDADGILIGVSLGLLGAGATMHSHITGVLAEGRRLGVGLALKRHQREWALAHGLHTITWTCDPLVRRNVGFNLHALGARVVHYFPDFYGPMHDGLNAGDASDRFEVVWDLAGPQTIRAEDGRIPAVEHDLPAALADVDGAPVAAAVDGPRTVALPADIEALRRIDTRVAHEWRLAVRDVLVPALDEGLVIAGLDAVGAIVLVDPSQEDSS